MIDTPCLARLPTGRLMLIDGDDLLFAVRTSREGGNNHDAELVTFHRLPDFRSLALDVHPEV